MHDNCRYGLWQQPYDQAPVMRGNDMSGAQDLFADRYVAAGFTALRPYCAPESEGIKVNSDYYALDELRFELSVAVAREEAREVLRRFEQTDRSGISRPRHAAQRCSRVNWTELRTS